MYAQRADAAREDDPKVAPSVADVRRSTQYQKATSLTSSR
jgi:hypothetical protein